MGVALVEMVITQTIFDIVRKPVASVYSHRIIPFKLNGLLERLIASNFKFLLRCVLHPCADDEYAFDRGKIAEYWRCLPDSHT